MRIIYVEDNPANLALVRRVARLGKHDVESFTEGEDALDTIVKSPPDLLLVDIQLSGAMSGLDLMLAVRDKEIEIPTVAVTAYAMLGDKERCLDAGFTEYLPKPLPVADLVALFAKYSARQSTALTATTSVATLTTSAIPTASDKPTEPEAPTTPEKPTASTAQTTTDTPATTNTPSTPSTPATSSTPPATATA